MAGTALGLIETVGLAAAAAALDQALDTADVKYVGSEKVIGAGKSISVTIRFVGEVAAVEAAVEAGCEAAGKIGTVLGFRVIPKPHDEVCRMLDLYAAEAARKKPEGPKTKTSDKEEKQ